MEDKGEEGDGNRRVLQAEVPVLSGTAKGVVSPTQVLHPGFRQALLAEADLDREVPAGLLAQPAELAEERPDRRDLGRSRQRVVRGAGRDLHELPHL